ncbi:MAG: gliding motility-associated C-terminal domain-containing protein [Bacteroidales bacterium]|nr:gliding motility-associated C-terminal domain-containing protein [Bacteroidales bacterium]
MGLLLGIWGAAKGQFFENPSFEGIPGIAIAPPSWLPLDEHSTPDTEPLNCDEFKASHGDTYLTLVTRGPDHDLPNSVENTVTSLLKPLEEGKYYRLTVDLASRDDVGHFTWEDGFVAYNYPVKMMIYASTHGSVKDILMAESVPITNQSWDNFSFILFPQTNIQHLAFEAQPANETQGSGNLLLDRLHLEEIDEPLLEFGDLVVPNVFTPNGDGSNDEFMIRGLARGSSLLIYDRTGKEVYKSDNYEHNWNGRDMNGRELTPDTYWYVLFPSDMSEIVKGFVYLKRQ